MTSNSELNLKYDFSGLSKGRLKTFNLLAEEIDRMESESYGVRALDDNELEMLNAAGNVIVNKGSIFPSQND